MHDSGLKQNPISGVLVYNLRNRFISTRLSVIQNQHRLLVVGHPVLCSTSFQVIQHTFVNIFVQKVSCRLCNFDVKS